MPNPKPDVGSAVLRLSWFNSCFAQDPKTEELTFSNLAERFQTDGFEELESKTDGRAWCPAVFNGSRKAENVESVNFWVADLDAATDEQIAETLRRLTGKAYILHSSFSNSPEQTKARLICPLAVPVGLGAWAGVWRRLVGALAPWSDKKCKDPGRIYFTPSKPPGSEHSWIHVQNGASLDPEDFAPVSSPTLAAVSGERVLTREVLSKLAAKLGRSSAPERVDLGERMKRAIRGESFAEKGERDSVAWSLVSAIASAYPDASDRSLDVFGQSINRMAAENPSDVALSLEDLKVKLKRAKEKTAERNISKESASEFRQKQRISQAFGTGRTSCYSPKELNRIAKILGVDREGLDAYWILQYRGGLFCLYPGPRYVEVHRTQIDGFARLALAPTGIDIEDETGEEFSPKELLKRYATPIEGLIKCSYIETPEIQRLPALTARLPSAVKRKIAPKFDEKIDHWLRLLGGENVESFFDWLAMVPDTKDPLCALVLVGAKGSGKSLLAQGLSRIWTEKGPTEYSVAVGDYNADFENCPLVLADESLPRDGRGFVRTDQLREFIQRRQFRSNEKYQVAVTLQGCARLIIAANNDQILDLREHQTRDDIKAIAERFFYVKAPEKAANYLKKIGGEALINSKWIAGDSLAAHVLHLSETREAKRQGRFGVEIDTTEIADQILIRTGLRSAVCEFLVKWLFIPGNIPVNDDPDLFTSNGSIYVHAPAVVNNWAAYMRNEPAPKTAALTLALDALKDDQIELDGKIWDRIPLERIAFWAESNGYSSKKKIEKKAKALEYVQEKEG